MKMIVLIRFKQTILLHSDFHLLKQSKFFANYIIVILKNLFLQVQSGMGILI
jgi:hypothetical protein